MEISKDGNSFKTSDQLFNIKGETIEYYRNAACFLTSSVVSLNIGYCYLVQNNNLLYYSWPFLYSYFLFDFPFSKLDIKLHHIFGLCLLSSIYLLNIPLADFDFILLPIYKTEITTFFLLFKLWNKDNYLVNRFKLSPIIFNLNDLLFFTLFFKYRIVDYYQQIINNPNTYLVINIYSKNNVLSGCVAYSGVLGLMALNTYWFFIMCKIIFKRIIKNYNNHYLELIAEKILSYTYFLNIFIAGYNYSYSPNSGNIYDMIGIINLSVFSYYYHSIIHNFLSNNNVDLDSDDDSKNDLSVSDKRLVTYLNDKLSIHTRSFLCVLTSCGFDLQSKLILNEKSIVSALMHTNFYLLAIFYIYFQYGKNTETFFIKSAKKTKTNLMLNLLISAPIVYDTYVIVSNSNNFSASVNLIFLTYLIGLILKLEPFYELNHLAFHVLLMIQTHFLSINNLRT